MMNKRIHDLMIQAGYAAPEIAVRAQKLVEFVINECVVVCEQQRNPQGLNYKPTETFSNAIKNHFDFKG